MAKGKKLTKINNNCKHTLTETHILRLLFSKDEDFFLNCGKKFLQKKTNRPKNQNKETY